MTIIEQTVVPKSHNRRSEDGIVVSDDFVAVIDGSTSKSTLRCHRSYHGGGLRGLFRDYSNGEQAMRIVAHTISHLPKDASCHQFCKAATAAVRKYYLRDKLAHLKAHPEDRLAASCIVFSRLRREVWMIGDCQGLAISTAATASPSGPSSLSSPSSPSGLSGLSSPSTPSSPSLFFDNPKPCEQELAEMRAAIIKSSPKPWDHFRHDDTARKAIIPRMVETMAQQNSNYSVIDGFPVDEAHIKVFTLDFQPWEVVLATDGYPFLCPTLAESEARLAWQRDNDPLNIGTFKATKAFAEGCDSFDDRAYIRFRV